MARCGETDGGAVGATGRDGGAAKAASGRPEGKAGAGGENRFVSGLAPAGVAVREESPASHATVAAGAFG